MLADGGVVEGLTGVNGRIPLMVGWVISLLIAVLMLRLVLRCCEIERVVKE
jgi:hypothetical protein